MSLSSVERLYGYGAARLRLGHPVHSRRLSARRDRSVRGEMRFAFMPGLLCVLTSVLLFSTTYLNRFTPGPTSDFVEVDPLRIELVLPPETLVALKQEAPPIEFAAPTPRETHGDVPQAMPKTKPRPPAPIPEFARLEVPTESTRPPNISVRPRDISDPRPTHSAKTALDANWSAHAVAETRTRRAPVDFKASEPSLDYQDGRRPERRSASAAPNPVTYRPTQSRQFAATQGLPAEGPAGYAAAAKHTTPHVSSSRPATLEAIRESLATAQGKAGRGDWREVPLGSLPDCTPAGRQDRLKQEILRRTPENRVCEHASGRFRFVPARNLGSFLMWTEGQTLSHTYATRSGDACVVLEAALRCLTQPGTQP